MDLDKVRMMSNLARGSRLSEEQTVNTLLNGLGPLEENQIAEIKATVAKVFAIPAESFNEKFDAWFSFVQSKIA